MKVFSKSKFPSHEKFALLNQLWRALDSIILNIAEGSDRGTDKDFARFLNNSQTSLNEVVACIDIAFDCGYINSQDHGIYLNLAAELANQITAFRMSLIKNPKK